MPPIRRLREAGDGWGDRGLNIKAGNATTMRRKSPEGACRLALGRGLQSSAPAPACRPPPGLIPAPTPT